METNLVGLQNKPLRVGLLLNSFDVPAWVYTLIAEIQHGGYAVCALAVINRSTTSPRPLKTKLATWRHWFFYLVYVKLDRRFNRTANDAFASRDLRDLLGAVPTVDVWPRQTRHCDFIEGAELAQIGAFDIDVMLRFGFRILKGDILRLPRYGIWSFHHDDNAEYRGGPSGFWEVFEDNPVTGATLQVLNDDIDNGTVLDKVYSVTQFFSVEANRQSCYWKSLYSLPRQLEQLHALGAERYFAARERFNRFRFYPHRIYKVPGNRRFVQALISYVPRYVARRWRRSTTFEHWFLLYDLSEDVSTSLRRFKKIQPPPDRFWADPFVVHRDSRYFIFIEEFLYRTNRGHIAVIEMNARGEYTPPRPVIEHPYHMSYPYVFEWQGEFYMIPETRHNRTVELYRCTRFPDQWELYKVLLRDLIAVDTTLHHHNDRWYMFANIRAYPLASNYEALYLFSADQPLSDNWQPHLLNPVVVDPRCARPAGRLFERDGMLLRPAQDCSRGYGFGLVLNEVLVLDQNDYREQVYQTIGAEWDPGLAGVHTFNHEGRLTVSDAKVLRRKWSRRS